MHLIQKQSIQNLTPSQWHTDKESSNSVDHSPKNVVLTNILAISLEMTLSEIAFLPSVFCLLSNTSLTFNNTRISYPQDDDQ